MSILEPGSQIGIRRADGTTVVGTLGCFVRFINGDGTIMMLSNYHVLVGLVKNARPYLPLALEPEIKVGSPKVSNCGLCYLNVIGKVLLTPTPSWFYDNNTKDLSQLKDYALASIDSSQTLRNSFKSSQTKTNSSISTNNIDEKILGTSGIPNPFVTEVDGIITGIGKVRENDRVWKIGSKTGLTKGIVTKVYENGNVFLIAPLIPYKQFCEGGDSGSAIIKEGDANGIGRGELIGLLTTDRQIIDPSLTSYNTIPNYRATDSSAIKIQTIIRDYNIEIMNTSSPFVSASELSPISPIQKVNTDELHQEIDVAKFILTAHQDEIAYLINHNRAVKLTWHRNKGPAFLNQILQIAQNISIPLNQQIEEISLQQMLTNMAVCLKKYGGSSLKVDLEKYGLTLIQITFNEKKFRNLLLELNKIIFTN